MQTNYRFKYSATLVLLMVFVCFIVLSCAKTDIFVVQFDSKGGTPVELISVFSGSKIESPNIMKEGYTLVGWYTSSNQGETLDEEWVFSEKTVISNVILYAKWEAAKYLITFVIDDTTSNSFEVTYNSIIALPQEPVKQGYIFDGWFLDETLTEPFNTQTMPARNITIHAKFVFIGARSLIIYYHRPIGDYNLWRLWIWPSEPVSSFGQSYDLVHESGIFKFTSIDLTVPHYSGTSEIGIVISKPDWSAKDIVFDRFIDLTRMNNDREVIVYLYQDDPTVYYQPRE